MGLVWESMSEVEVEKVLNINMGMRKYVRSWESMRKHEKVWESMSEVGVVVEKVLILRWGWVWESMSEVENIISSKIHKQMCCHRINARTIFFIWSHITLSNTFHRPAKSFFKIRNEKKK